MTGMAFYSMILINLTNIEETKGQGRQSRGLNDRVHGISCRYSDKTCQQINYISTNIHLIIMQ